MFIIDPHIHSAEISPCGKVNAARLISLYKNAGYQGLIITDHLSTYCPIFREKMSWKEKIDLFFTGYDLIKKIGENAGLVILSGFEITFNRIPNDFLVYGIDKEWLYRHENLLDSTIEKFAESIIETGAVIIQAHPFRNRMIPREKPHIHGVEVYNGNPRHDSQNIRAMEYAESHSLIPVSGSDFHQEQDCARGGMKFEYPIQSVEAFVSALRNDTPGLIQTH